MRQTHRTVDESFSQFQLIVGRRGGNLVETSSHDTGNRESLLLVESRPCLRLQWRNDDQVLVLEVSHGPDSGNAGWLDLITGTDLSGRLLFSTVNISFEDAVTHGLDPCRLTNGCD